MTPPPRSPQVYSHELLQLPPTYRGRFRIGYRGEPAADADMFRVSRAVAVQIADDMHALRAETLALAAQAEEFYADAVCTADVLPRVEMHGEHFVVDRRHISSSRYAVRTTEPDHDGLYTLGFDLGWRQVAADRCEYVRDDSTWLSPVVAAYQAYVGCFIDAAAAVRDLGERAGIAVAYLDRAAVEACSRPLLDDEWALIRQRLHHYDQYLSAGDHDLLLNQIFSAAGLDRYRANTPDSTAS
jgi:hypothetical protein